MEINMVKSNNNKDKDKCDEARQLELFEAEICENAHRYEDMVNVMKRISMTYNELTQDERNLLSCAYKNVLGSRRTSRRFLCERLNREKSLIDGSNKRAKECDSGDGSNTESKDGLSSTGRGVSGRFPTTDRDVPEEQEAITNLTADNKIDLKVIESLLSEVESELIKYCDEILNIIDQRLIPSAPSSGEAIVLYYKMKGDYLRYLSEIYEGTERRSKSSESLEAYKIASNKAIIELPPTHPARLSLMLNFSVFYHEILESPERSISLAKQAFDDAIAELDTLSEESYRDSTVIMQLLRDNLKMWEAERT